MTEPQDVTPAVPVVHAGYKRLVISTRNRYREILWPRRRRGTRPYRWPGSRCWRRSRRRRCRCGCGGAGCWRGGRRRRSRGRRRWRTSSHCSKNIDPPPTIDVVWRASISALSRSDMHSGVIQSIATRSNLMPKAWNSRPEQGHRAGDMWSSHGRATEICIRTICVICGRTGVRTRCTDVGLDPVASVDCDRATTAKGRNRISTGVQRTYRIGRRVNSGRSCDGRTTRPSVLCRRHHHNTSSSLCFHGSLQCVERTTFRRRAIPGVVGDVRCLGGVRVPAADLSRGQEPLHAFDVTGRCAVASIHVAATNPFCARRHSNLVTHAIVTDHCTGGV